MTTSAVVLAAGRSSRAGCVKALCDLHGRTFLERTIDNLRKGGCASVVVVVAAPHEAAVRASRPTVCFARNAEPGRGMFSSLQCGLSQVSGDTIVALVDHPRVAAKTIADLISVASQLEAAWVRPSYQGRGGHPYYLRASAISMLLAQEATLSTREVLRTMSSASFATDDPHVLDDFDTSAQLALPR